MTLGQKIKELRESKGMFQRQLASILEIGDGFLSKVIGNFYMKFNEGKYPTKMFLSETEAIDWIKSLEEVE